MNNYNDAHLIREALEAILLQSHRPDEVLVVDDGSTDNSIEVIESFCRRDPLVRLVRNDRNRGVVLSANGNIDRASGDYLFFACADDRVLPGFFEKSMRALAEHPQAGLVCSDPVWLEDDILRTAPLGLSAGPRYFTPQDLVQAERRHHVMIPGHTSVVKRSAVLGAGKLLADLKWYSDWFMNFVIAFRHGLCYLPEGLSAMRVSATSYSGKPRPWPVQRDVLDALVRRLHSPDYCDVLPLFLESGVLAQFDTQILRLLLRKPQHVGMLTPLLARRLLRSALYGYVWPVTPQPIKTLCRRIRSRCG